MEGRSDPRTQYLGYLGSVRDLAPHTLRAYERDLDSWKGFLDRQDKDLFQADKALAGGFLGELKKKGLAASSANRVLSCLRGFYRFLIRNGRAAVNPFAGLRNLKAPKRLPVFLFEKEIGHLLDLPGPGFQGRRDAFILELLYSTGCRISEVTAADLRDLAPDLRSLRVLGKGRKVREVFLTDAARRALGDYLALREAVVDRQDADALGALLISRRGKRLSNVGLAKMLAHYVRKAGIAKKVTPHTFRHTFATHLLQEGLDIRVVQELLGHSRLATTQVYTHLDLDRLRDVVRSAHPHG